MAEEQENLTQTPPEGTQPPPEAEVITPPEATLEAPPKVEAPPPPSPELEDLRRQLTERDTELQGYRTKESQYEEWNKATRVEAYAKQLIAAHPTWDEDAARQVALAQYNAYFSEERAKQADTNAKRQYQGQVLEAIELAKKYGGSVEELLKLSPAEMRTQARNMGKIASLEAKVADLTKKTVPAQTFETGAGGGGGELSLEALLQKDPAKMTHPELLAYNKELDAKLQRTIRQGR